LPWETTELIPAKRKIKWASLSGFYETAVLVKVFFCFSFVAFLVFVFAVAVCWFQDSSRASIRTLDEPLAARCLLGSDVDELGLLSKARPLGPSR
jgi:hypothetical protein